MLGIYLKTWRFPDGVYTTLAAWYEFIEQLTAAAGRRPGAKKTAARASTKRQSSVEAEIDVIRTSIRRKTTRTGQKTAHANLCPQTPMGQPTREPLVRGQSVQALPPTGAG